MAESVNRWNVNGVYYEIHDYGRGLPGGVATLDQNGRIPYQQLPESTIEYKGTWDASTNTPHLADGTGNQGDMYFCVTSGTVTLGTDRTIAFYIGDRVVYDGAIWERLPAGGVYTVNNKEGDVVLYGTDIQRTADDTKTIAQAITDVEDVIQALDVEDPTSSGNAIAFIKSISQTDGKIEPLKATIPDASATQAGITRKTDTYMASSTDAMTGKAVAEALRTISGVPNNGLVPINSGSVTVSTGITCVRYTREASSDTSFNIVISRNGGSGMLVIFNNTTDAPEGESAIRITNASSTNIGHVRRQSVMLAYCFVF